MASDANANVLTITAVGITDVGSYSNVKGAFVKSGKTYNTTNGRLTVIALTANSISATFLVEGADWALYDGKLDATF